VCAALDIDWDTAYWDIAEKGYVLADMPSSNAVWGAVLITVADLMPVVAVAMQNATAWAGIRLMAVIPVMEKCLRKLRKTFSVLPIRLSRCNWGCAP